MKAQYLKQVVFCSLRDGRAFLREIAVTLTDAMVTRIETLPPGYEHAIAQMRHAQEHIYQAPANPKLPPDYKGCPYCGNRNTFKCSCGALSCLSRDADHTTCPVCGTISRLEPATVHPASESGLTGKRMPLMGLWERIGRGERVDGQLRIDDYTLLVDRNKTMVRRNFEEQEPPRRSSVEVTMDPTLNAPPPVKGLLEASPDDRAKMRQWLMKRNKK
jgi:hypothetical protein